MDLWRSKKMELEKKIEENEKLELANGNCLYESIKETLKEEFEYIGEQERETPNSHFGEYNCKKCGTTIAEEHIVSHYVNNHYAEGIKLLREIR
jgi:hypothetical protein